MTAASTRARSLAVVPDRFRNSSSSRPLTLSLRRYSGVTSSCLASWVKTLELGQSFARSRSLIRRARAVLADLARETREAAHVAVMRDYEVVHVAGDQTERPVMSGLRLGQRLPAHCTALGKVLLGCAPEETRQGYDREVVDGGELPARTDSTRKLSSA